MNTQRWLNALTVRHEWHAKMRDMKLAQRSPEADTWHYRCQRLTNAISYLESRLERAQ